MTDPDTTQGRVAQLEEQLPCLEFKLSVLLFRGSEMWVAQCLDYDIAAQGKTITEAKEAFALTFAGQVFVDLHHGVAPLAGFAQAPREYWDRFKTGERLADRQPIFIPNDTNVRASAEDLRVA